MPAVSRAQRPGVNRASVPRNSAQSPRHPPTLDPIITMNSAGIIQSASDSVEEVFGWTPTELFGRNVKVLIPEPRRSALDRYLDRYRFADRARPLTRMRHFDAVRKDGKMIRIELSMSRADLPASASPFFIGIIRDITHEIDVSADNPAERSRLQKLITAQTRALATASLRLHLADRLASLGTLAAGLGHDMNNVLLPVRARLNALEHSGVSPAAQAHITAVRRSVAYLQHLSDGLHFLALDPDGPGIAADAEGTTDLAQWWSQMGGLLRKAVPSHVKIHASLASSLPQVHIAPHWLTQAVLNLLVNAGESVAPGRHTGRIRLFATARPNGETVRLSVADNGRGMSVGIQRRAFDLFFTTKSRGIGTGLGLPLARRVAHRAGGDVQIRSTPGKGTTVDLILPTATRPRGQGAQPASPRSTHCAAVSFTDHRTAALVAQALAASGTRVRSSAGTHPGQADLWVTRPTRAALSVAKRWRKGHPERVLIVVGAPPKSAREAWGTLNATIIIPPDDFEAIRESLNRVIAKWTPPAQENQP